MKGQPRGSEHLVRVPDARVHLARMLRRSHSATDWSAEPVARTNSGKGLHATLLISALCVPERAEGAGSRDGTQASHTSSRRSSPTDASR